MRPPVVNFATGRAALALATAALLSWTGGPRSRAQDASTNANPPPVPNASASVAPGKGKTNKNGKKASGANATAPAAKEPKPIPFPLPPGEDANTIRIPETGLDGRLLSQLMAQKATRIDNEHVRMNGMNLDLYHPDGKEDFHIIMPTSVFNLKTRIITSEDPVTVHTQDFDLTGEKMEFNTVDRTGRLIGKVRMLVHNLKQVAGLPDASPKPE